MDALTNWLPYKLLAPHRCQWLYLADRRFREPFFEETLSKCLSHPYNSSRFKVITALEDLEPLSLAVESVPPSAFVFHVSRCGSTLLTQLLSLGEDNIVVPECPLLDDLLRLPGTNERERGTYARALIRLLGQRRFAEENHFFVKLDSWHLFLADTIARLYPDTPRVFLYRDPAEVIASHYRHPGIQAVPGLLPYELLGLGDYRYTTHEDYLTAMLEKLYAAMLAAYAGVGRHLLLNYSQGGLDIYLALRRFLNLPMPNDEDQQRLHDRLGRHAKYPDEGFREQNTANTPPVSERLQSLYQQLENKRLARFSSTGQAF